MDAEYESMFNHIDNHIDNKVNLWSIAIGRVDFSLFVQTTTNPLHWNDISSQLTWYKQQEFDFRECYFPVLL